MATNQDIVQSGGEFFGGANGQDDIYKMSAKIRGYCCLFLNKTFRSGYYHNIRDGAEKDMVQLKSVFEQLNFEIYDQDLILDLNSNEFMPTLDNILSNTIELKTHDAFIAVFSTHGNESVICGSDCKEVLIVDIINKFNNKNCPSLIGKPKIFIFLCCRGDNVPEAIKLQQYYTGLPSVDHDENEAVPIMEDIIICYSTVNSFVSIRNTLEGTFYGRFLATNIQRYAKDKDLEYILKKTAHDMSRQNVLQMNIDGTGSVDIKLMSSWRAIGWQKMLYFNPGHPI